VYIPLGGSRQGEAGTYRNLLLTMLIGGLWHGANWTFVVWGLYHGALLAVHRRFGEEWSKLPGIMRQAAMFVLVLIGWVFFRSTDFTMAAWLLNRMFTLNTGALLDGAGMLTVMAVAAGWWAMRGKNAFDLDRSMQEPDWTTWDTVRLREAFVLAAGFNSDERPARHDGNSLDTSFATLAGRQVVLFGGTVQEQARRPHREAGGDQTCGVKHLVRRRKRSSARNRAATAAYPTAMDTDVPMHF
jgi:hypothetical protein